MIFLACSRHHPCSDSIYEALSEDVYFYARKNPHMLPEKHDVGVSFTASELSDWFVDPSDTKTSLGFDHKHLEECDSLVLVLPCGPISLMEASFVLGRGKPVYVLLMPVEGPSEVYEAYRKKYTPFLPLLALARGVFNKIEDLRDTLDSSIYSRQIRER